MTPRRKLVSAFVAASAWPAAGLLPGGPAGAQTASPRDGTAMRQLTIIVPFPPGGTTDAVARLVGEGLRGSYAANVVIDNRVGASGRIGLDHLKGRPADGSVLLHAPAFLLAIFPHIYRRLSYDALGDFAPVALTSRAAYGLAIGPAVPAAVTDLRGFVAWCGANVPAATFATVMGSSLHFAGVVFARAAGIALEPVPYRGGAPAMADVIAGHVPSIVSPLGELGPLMSDPRLRVLAVTGARRSRFLPETPTMSEAGLPDVVVEDWSGFIAPGGTPPGVVLRANAAINAYLGSRRGADALLAISTEAEVEDVAGFAATVRSSWERYRGIVGSTGFVAEE